MNFIPEFKQVLSSDGWIDIGQYYRSLKRHSNDILVIKDNRCIFTCPRSFSEMYYNGPMLEFSTDSSRVILKPNSVLDKELSLYVRGDTFKKYYSHQEVLRKESVLWEGSLFSLYFGTNVLLPIKFENDYILLPI